MNEMAHHYLCEPVSIKSSPQSSGHPGRMLVPMSRLMSHIDGASSVLASTF